MRAEISSNMSKELVCVHSFVEYIMCTLQMWSMTVVINFFQSIVAAGTAEAGEGGGLGG